MINVVGFRRLLQVALLPPWLASSLIKMNLCYRGKSNYSATPAALMRFLSHFETRLLKSHGFSPCYRCALWTSGLTAFQFTSVKLGLGYRASVWIQESHSTRFSHDKTHFPLQRSSFKESAQVKHPEGGKVTFYLSLTEK